MYLLADLLLISSESIDYLNFITYYKIFPQKQTGKKRLKTKYRNIGKKACNPGPSRAYIVFLPTRILSSTLILLSLFLIRPRCFVPFV
jgi:hypothetical protein